jgi:hypothetical protein
VHILQLTITKFSTFYYTNKVCWGFFTITASFVGYAVRNAGHEEGERREKGEMYGRKGFV